MDKLDFKNFLYSKIPITKEMGIDVLEFSSSKVTLLAKLKPNINHKSTAFGGSINSLMTVCGWSLVYKNISEIDANAHIVIQKSNIDYLNPIKEDFSAICELKDEKIKTKFLETFKKHNKSRLKLKVFCYKNDTLLAEFEGYYVIFK